MSLLNTASPWTSSQTIKRTPSIGKRKTQRAIPKPKKDDNSNYDNDDDAAAGADDDNGFWTDILDHNENSLSESMKSTITMNEERGHTVNDMLNKITASSAGDGLVDFRPVSSPGLAKNTNEGFESPLLKRAAGLPQSGGAHEYVPSDIGMDALSNYNKSYEAGAILGKPYYSMNKSSDDGNSVVMQKLNYITHILEDLQLEKTSNITEELILYSFLGVFVIFMVDSFARVGKYHR
jgi:hypothetical protein